MSFGALREPPALVTLVLRIWPVESPRQGETFRLQATHVQTGEVAYFRTIEGVANHIERLIQTGTMPPIDLSNARGRSKKHA
jgi:hypothetical protein